MIKINYIKGANQSKNEFQRRNIQINTDYG